MEYQRACILFCFKNEIPCSQVVSMLQKAFGDQALNRTSVFERYSKFRDGRESLGDEPRSGRPVTATTNENVEKAKQIMLNNRRISLRALAGELHVGYNTCRAIGNDQLGAKMLAATRGFFTMTTLRRTLHYLCSVFCENTRSAC